jgi:hypothetical protein
VRLVTCNYNVIQSVSALSRRKHGFKSRRGRQHLCTALDDIAVCLHHPFIVRQHAAHAIFSGYQVDVGDSAPRRGLNQKAKLGMHAEKVRALRRDAASLLLPGHVRRTPAAIWPKQRNELLVVLHAQ